MNDDRNKSVRLQRPSRAGVDEHGKTVWDGPEVETEYELLSTQRLLQILSEDDAQRQHLEAIADEEGVVVRRADTDSFEVIDEDDLKAALASAAEDDASDVVPGEPVAETVDPEESAVSLVSTMALRRILNEDGDAALEPLDQPDDVIRQAGFDTRDKD